MGTITRTFANNITTSGVFKPTAFNNASFDNVTAVPSGAVEGGNMVLLSTQTATAGTATIDFTTGIDSTYKEYLFILNNLHPDNNNTDMSFNLSSDGGSNYNVTKTSSAFYARQNEDTSGAELVYWGVGLAQSTANQTITAGVGNENDECATGYLHLFNPSDTTYVKHFTCVTQCYTHSNYSWNSYVAGYANTTSAINAVRFNSTSNFDDGTIQMFGIL
jgi:hypothetical protein